MSVVVGGVVVGGGGGGVVVAVVGGLVVGGLRVCVGVATPFRLGTPPLRGFVWVVV